MAKLTLPDAPTPPRRRLEDFVILLYGPPKIGKTTWASQMDKPLFLACEAGLRAIEAYQVPVGSWTAFLEAASLIAKGGHDFRTIVIDTVDNLYTYCADHVFRIHGIHHESDLEWGKGWNLVASEFMRALTKLSLLPYGLVLISHAEDKEIKTRTHTYTKAVPSLPKRARRIVLNMADMILYAHIARDGGREERVVSTRPSEQFEAGDRTGRLPPRLPLDFNEFRKHFEEGEASA